MLLFDGYRHTYGTYGAKLAADDGGKKMKGQAHTIKGDVTTEIWTDHLMGKRGIGIIPIDETNRVRFAAIDIDEYALDLVELNGRIQKLKLPLVLCRTKSGGAHLFLFLDTWYPAADIQRKMREMAALLGYGNSEIFPKQAKIVVERGDVGSWINMPYFNSVDTARYALDAEGKPLIFPEFMSYARLRIVSYTELLNTITTTVEPLPDGPPCLNHLCSMGFPEGTRNNGLFNIAVYCKKKWGDAWEPHLHEYNGLHMIPPLSSSEVQGIVKSLHKKEFNYTCKQAPIANYCNMPKCRTCKHGVGFGDTGMPRFGSLTKLLTVPPIWFLDVEGGGRLELSTEDLQNPKNFQNVCMATLNVMPILPKAGDWQEIIHKLLEDVTEIPIPEEATPRGQLWQHLEDFCTSRTQARNVDELILGKPWLNNGFYYFRIRDLLAYLERQKWRELPTSYIAMFMKDWGCGKKFWNIRGRGVNCYFIKEDAFKKQEESFETPKQVNPEKVL
jgi:hypothetical protein